MSGFCFKLRELAEIVGGEISGDADVEINGVAGIREARMGDITFVANSKYEEFVDSTGASAVIASPTLSSAKPLIHTDNPYFAFLKVLNLFAEETAIRYPVGAHALSTIHPEADIGEGVSIGPFCHISARTRIGANTTILCGTYVGEGVDVGGDCMIYSNVSIREGSSIGNGVILQPGVVVGSDGFGYAKDGNMHHKVPQIGRVVIEDDVEIGANSCIDRATTGETRIRRGSKIDNLVQIAHNVEVGEDSIIAAQVGISGSALLKKNVVFGGQAGAVGHITIGEGATVGARGGVTKDVPEHTTVSGYPAREHMFARKLYAHTAKLPELFKRVRDLERQLEEFRGGGAGDPTTKDA